MTIETQLSYLVRTGERPRYYTFTPPEGPPARNVKGDRHVLPVHDARRLDPSLDVEGFELAGLSTGVDDLFDDDRVREVYYREACELVAKATSAARVEAFDHNLRSMARDELQGPVRFVHNDYTDTSGPQRVRDLFPDEAEALLSRRFAVINVWKPITPVRTAPLAFCDARGIAPEDFLPTDLVYPDRTGEIYSFTFSREHRWYYYPAMQPDEVLLLKCYDSDPDRARYTAHSAFDDPTSPEDAPPRESIEVRTLAFF